MINDCGAEVLVTQGIHVDNINSSYTPNIKHCVLLDDDSIPLPDTYRRYTVNDINSQSMDNIVPCNTPDDLIYMIYTSVQQDNLKVQCLGIEMYQFFEL